MRAATVHELYRIHPDFFLAPFDQHGITGASNFGITSNKKTFIAWLKTIPRETRAQYFKFNEALVNLLKEQKLFDAYHFALTGKAEYSERAVRQLDALSEENSQIIFRFLIEHEVITDLIFIHGGAIQDMALSYENYLLHQRGVSKKQIRLPSGSTSSEDEETESQVSGNDSEKENGEMEICAPESKKRKGPTLQSPSDKKQKTLPQNNRHTLFASSMDMDMNTKSGSRMEIVANDAEPLACNESLLTCEEQPCW